MTDLDTQTSIVGDYWREQYLMLKDENEELRLAMEGFMRCAEQRWWPSEERMQEGQRLLGRQ